MEFTVGLLCPLPLLEHIRECLDSQVRCVTIRLSFNYSKELVVWGGWILQ